MAALTLAMEGDGEAAQSVESLLCKHEDLTSDPWRLLKKLRVVPHACSPKAGRGGFLGLAIQPI